MSLYLAYILDCARHTSSRPSSLQISYFKHTAATEMAHTEWIMRKISNSSLFASEGFEYLLAFAMKKFLTNKCVMRIFRDRDQD
jgi:hypothetical protein